MPLSAQSLSKGALLVQALATLQAAGTLVGQNVLNPAITPVQANTFPALTVATPSERKEAYGGPGGVPRFDSTVALAVMARVKGAGSDLASKQASALAQLDQLIDQVELAILCSPDMLVIVQQFQYVESHAVLTDTSQDIIGEGTVIFGCQVWQEYQPNAGAPLTEFVTTVPAEGSGPAVRFDSTSPP